MASKWRILDLLEFEGFVHYERGAINADGIRAPLADVAVILLGPKTQWGYGLVAGAERFDVHILVCDWRNLPVGILQHTSPASRVGARQRSQASLIGRTRDAAWKRIIRAKIAGQAAVLANAGAPSASKQLEILAKNVEGGDKSNLEGAAARIYWSSFADDFRRNQTASDFLNCALNYGYTILRGAVITGICSAGLITSLGIHHGSERNPFPLADDLIEPFRPCVDSTVLRLQESGSTHLGATEKRELAGVLEQCWPDTNQRVRTEIYDLCSNYGRFVEREVASLAVPTWKPAV